MTTITLKPIIKEAWKLARKHFWKFFLALIVLFILNGARSALSSDTMMSYPHARLFSLIAFVLYIIGLWVGLGLKNLSLRLANKQGIRVADIFVSWIYFIKFLIAGIIVAVFVLVGFALLIVPGIIVAIRLSLVPYFILDKKLCPRNAIKASWAATKGFGRKLFGFYLLLGAINLLGFICLMVGMFWTMPLAMIAGAMMYRKLAGSSKLEAGSQKVGAIEKKKIAAPKKRVVKKKTFTSKK